MPSRCCGPADRWRRSTRCAPSANCSPRTPASTRPRAGAPGAGDPAPGSRAHGPARGAGCGLRRRRRRRGCGLPRPRSGRRPRGRPAGLELATAVLDRLAQGSPALATVIGEPGIGKSWLVRHLGDEARANGVCVAVRDLLAGRRRTAAVALARRAARSGGRHRGRRATPVASPLADVISAEAGASGPGRLAFQTWDRIARAVLAAARRRPVLVVLDDLHWADEATLRALRHLVSVTPDDVALAVVATRRRHPETRPAPWPMSGSRSPAGRPYASSCPVSTPTRRPPWSRAVAEGDVDPRTTEAWRQRSGGNPFFLVELARLGSSADGVPATVRDGRRPPRCRACPRNRWRRWASRPSSVARSASRPSRPPDSTTPRRWRRELEPARSAGLVVDQGADGYAFTHALTHEAVTLTVPPRATRPPPRADRPCPGDRPVAARARQCGRAHRGARPTLAGQRTHSGGPGLAGGRRRRRPGAARHRVPGGPARCGAARSPATNAWSAPASRIATGCCSSSPATPPTPPGGPPSARRRTRPWPWPARSAARISSDRPRRDSPATACGRSTTGWTSPRTGWTTCAGRCGPCPRRTRPSACMLLLSLAVELYYDAGAVAERAALVDAGLDLARRLADPAVLAWASRAAWLRPVEPVAHPGPAGAGRGGPGRRPGRGRPRGAGRRPARPGHRRPRAVRTGRVGGTGPSRRGHRRARAAALRALDRELGRDEPRRAARRPRRGRPSPGPRARPRPGDGPPDRGHPAGHRRHHPPRLGAATGRRGRWPS